MSILILCPQQISLTDQSIELQLLYPESHRHSVTKQNLLATSGLMQLPFTDLSPASRPPFTHYVSNRDDNHITTPLCHSVTSLIKHGTSRQSLSINPGNMDRLTQGLVNLKLRLQDIS